MVGFGGVFAESGRGDKAFPIKSTDFYRQILGISSPWKILSVEIDMKAKRVVITAEVAREDLAAFGHLPV